MHSVQRSPEPAFIAQLRSTYPDWDSLGRNQRDVRDALTIDFGTVCAYCEQRCKPQAFGKNDPNSETTDHFRPRSPRRFPNLWLDWLNLVYACHRCNESKADNWPGYDDAESNQRLSALYPRYIPPVEYVNPSRLAGGRPAHEYFDFDIDTGEITPSSALDDAEWSSARRTITDIDLNDSGLGLYDVHDLCHQRRERLDLLLQGIEMLDEFEARGQLMIEFTRPDRPFSSFIRAYVANEFPGLAEQIGAV